MVYKMINLKNNNIISKLKSMHLKLKLEDKISQGKYEMMTKRSNLQRKKLISLCCQCTKYTKEHSALFFFFFKIFLVTIQCTFGCKEHNALHFCMFIKKKEHVASRHLLGFDKSLCFNWVGSTW